MTTDFTKGVPVQVSALSTLAVRVPPLLGSLSPAEFLHRHWQKEPLFVAQAAPGYASPLSPDELAGLACEEGAESRLVYAHPRSPYQLEFGPFEEERFAKLGEANWTLLVQDVDKWVPEVGELLRWFDFIPSWRLDDVMVSFATPGGSVGPHVDNYDVFLLQVAGTRRWQVSRQFDATRLRRDTELAVLEQFEPEHEWLARPGDLLYLPPNIAHYGVALDECLTYSIGLRAPSDRELLRQFVQALDEPDTALPGASGERRYQDPDLEPAQAPGLVGLRELTRLAELLRQAVELPRAEQQRWLGSLLSQPKPHAASHGSAAWQARHGKLGAQAAIERYLKAGGQLFPNPCIRLCYLVTDGWVYLYADGQEYTWDPSLERLARLATGRRPFAATDLGELTGPCLKAIRQLMLAGWLRSATPAAAR